MKRGRVLYITESPQDFESVSNNKSEFDFELSLVKNFDEEFALIKSQGVGYYDLILVDLEVSNGQGVEIIRKIRGFDSSASLFLVSLVDSLVFDRIRNVVEEGVDFGLIKKISPNQILSEIQKLYQEIKKK